MIDDTQENLIKEFRFLSELVSLKNRVKELEDEFDELVDLNSDLITSLKNCINCKHRKWCKEIPDDFLACPDWDWED